MLTHILAVIVESECVFIYIYCRTVQQTYTNNDPIYATTPPPY